jgi:Leucine-rich repeat (LRR) protein
MQDQSRIDGKYGKAPLQRALEATLAAALVLALLPGLAFAQGDAEDPGAEPALPEALEQDAAPAAPGGEEQEALDADGTPGFEAFEPTEAPALAPAAVAYPVEIDAVSFPDPVFRAWVLNPWNCDTDGDGWLSQAEADAVNSINLSSTGVTSMQGIECFPDLSELILNRNNLTSLDLSQNTALTVLLCENNNLASLGLSQNNALSLLECRNNNLASLDLSHKTALTELLCSDNNLASLDLSQNVSLDYLACSDNNLASLDLTQNTGLRYFNCSNNNLASLDLSLNTVLTGLICSNNNLASLDLSQNTALTGLWCSNNNLASLDLSQNTALTNLNCSNNNLDSLDLSQNTDLETLYCSNNNLASLDLTQNTGLVTLYCSNNNLASLDLTQNTGLRYFNCSDNNLASLGLPQSMISSANCSYNRLLDVNGSVGPNFTASSQTVTIPVAPDPENPGTYLSTQAYSLAAGHTLLLRDPAASYDPATGRFRTTLLEAPVAFENNGISQSGSPLSGTITFVASGANTASGVTTPPASESLFPKVGDALAWAGAAVSGLAACAGIAAALTARHRTRRRSAAHRR